MKCKMVYMEVRKVDCDGLTQFFVEGSVTKFKQSRSSGKHTRYAVFVEWYDNDGAGVEGDGLCDDGMTEAQAIRKCIEWIDVCAWRLSRPLDSGVKVADSTDDDEDICF